MKILFLVNSLSFGGAERTVTYLTSYMADRGEDIVIYSMTAHVEYELNPRVRLVCGHLDKLHKGFIGRLYDISRRIIKINILIKKEKPDVVFCIVASIAKYLIRPPGKPYKLIVSERTNPKYAPRGEYELEKKIFERVDGIIFQTKRVRENYAGLIEGHNIVIPNAVGNPQVYETSWNPQGDKIVAIGRLVPEKDYPVMIDAFEIFLGSHSEYTLEIYGDGIERTKIETYVKEKNLTSKVIFHGPTPNVIKMASEAKCYIITSSFEGMPNTLMEAMAVGMPCIATDCEYGPSELIENEVSGLLVPVKDSVAIASALCRMVDDEEFAGKCGRNARKILEVQNTEVICKRYLDYFYNIAKKEKK